jgi:DNA-binding CsgD family transcriptional regulator
LQRRVDDINARLNTLRIGERSVVEELIPAVRELLDADNAIFYTLAEQEQAWRVDRWHHAGEVAHVGALLENAVAASARPIVFYDPRSPARWMRNRVIEVTHRIDRAGGPGSWLSWSVCQDVFRPARMEHHKHLRVLLCDGADLLGWLGTLVPEMPDLHHFRLLSALVPAFQRRLALERRLAEVPRALRALEVALDRIGAPAFIVDVRGVIREANPAARVLLDERRAEVAEAIADARAGRRNPLGIELTPITASGVPDAWLAILRGDSPDARIELAVSLAGARWTLTSRQRAVLERIVQGESNATIAANLNVSSRAIEMPVTALLDRAGVDSRSALVAAVLAY